jgi:general secretion pathway protein A
MYLDYFKLSEPPFSLTPDPRYLFMSERHREGLAHLLYGVQQPGGFVQLTGEIGSGKTTLCRCLIRQLPPDTDIALVLNPRLTAVELLATVCDELRISYPPHTESIKVLIDALNQRLLETHAQKRRTVLIIDEAQNLQSDVLEQIRLLTNLETSQEKLLQIILLGQPELLILLNGKSLKQLSQRITARYHLEPLAKSETHAYIQHRLLVAGRRDPIFTHQAMSLIFRLSRGVPRVINIICDRALLGAYARNRQRIGPLIVRKASRETSGYIPFYRRIPLALITAIALLAVLAFGGVAYFNPKVRSSLGWNEGTVATKSFTAPPSERAVSAGEPGKIIGGSGNKNPNNATLINIISQSSPSNVSGFADLYALWGVKISRKALSSGCKAGAAEGFECLFQTGNWPKLRRYNLPAILELLLPNGLRRQVVLCGLSKETATLIINERRYECPILEIDRLWDGSFILLWKPPFSERKLSSGAQGEPVQWVQRALNQLESLPLNTSVSGVYDDSLAMRVKAFQLNNSLVPDGYVGSETLIRLVLALEGSHVPRLSPKGQ